ncbi:MAG: hypothetical protein PWP52_883 [Bacteroidales bacterium]|nr:hypothetical protein [Bacteroidales bacterium]
MKKIILCISIFLLFSQIKGPAQENHEILNLLMAQTDNMYLKDFKTNLAPGGISHFSVVLSKNKNYEIFSYPANEVQVSLYDKKENNPISALQEDVNEKGIISKKYRFTETGVYHLEIKNKTHKKINTAILLTLAQKDDPEEVIISFTANKTEKEKKTTTTEAEELFFVVEEMPKFRYKEGDKIFTDFKDYIKYELNYPPEAKEQKIEGRVYIQFTVNKEGYIQDAKVMRGVHPALNQEALRIIYSSPRWKPGKQRGHKVNVSFTFPIVFKLNNQ